MSKGILILIPLYERGFSPRSLSDLLGPQLFCKPLLKYLRQHQFLPIVLDSWWLFNLESYVFKCWEFSLRSFITNSLLPENLLFFFFWFFYYLDGELPSLDFLILYFLFCCFVLFSWVIYSILLNTAQFSSFTQLCPTLCDPMNCSTPGSPVHHQFPELAQTHVHRVGDAIQQSHPVSSPSPLAFNLSQHQGLFQWVGFSHQVPKVLEFQLQNQYFQWIFRTDFL